MNKHQSIVESLHAIINFITSRNNGTRTEDVPDQLHADQRPSDPQASRCQPKLQEEADLQT